MKHFNSKLTSPHISLIGGYTYILVLSLVFYRMGLYKNSTFFSVGLPITFMGTEITSYTTYYGLLVLFFIHQLINSWVSTVAYPYIINHIQDSKSKHVYYSKPNALLIVNLFGIYSQLDVIFIVSGVASQFIFSLVLIIANILSTSIINWKYIKEKSDNYNSSVYEITEPIYSNNNSVKICRDMV
jgi:hypothetical protein